MSDINNATVAQAKTITRLVWLLSVPHEKLGAFIERTLADWLMFNYPDYEYHTWQRSKSLLHWWDQQWFDYDRSFLKELQLVDFRDRWEWYRMLHQYAFSGSDIKAQKLLADFEKQWPSYVKEIEEYESAAH